MTAAEDQQTRLVHSLRGLRRAMQISEVTFFVFVEGMDDKPFYDGICERVCAELRVTYEIASVNEVLGEESGGKTKLIALFDALKSIGTLADDFTGKRTVIAFFADKDVDDFCGTMIQNDHLIYTEHYHMENYWFLHCDLAKVVADAATLDRSSVRAHLGDQDRWRRRVVEDWREWVKLCLYAHVHQVRCGCTFRVESKIHRGCFAGVDEAVLAKMNQTLRKSALVEGEFEERWRAVSEWVDHQYARGAADTVFCGAWYVAFLTDAAQRIANERRASSGRQRVAVKRLPDRIGMAALASLDYSDAWTGYFAGCIRKLLTM